MDQFPKGFLLLMQKSSIFFTSAAMDFTASAAMDTHGVCGSAVIGRFHSTLFGLHGIVPEMTGLRTHDMLKSDEIVYKFVNHRLRSILFETTGKPIFFYVPIARRMVGDASQLVYDCRPVYSTMGPLLLSDLA
jgi:hypothetical protein